MKDKQGGLGLKYVVRQRKGEAGWLEKDPQDAVGASQCTVDRIGACVAEACAFTSQRGPIRCVRPPDAIQN
jgi:hypothetical protein